MSVTVTPPRATYWSEIPHVTVVKQISQVVISLNSRHEVIFLFSGTYKKMNIPEGVSSHTLKNSDVKLMKSVSNRDTVLFFVCFFCFALPQIQDLAHILASEQAV